MPMRAIQTGLTAIESMTVLAIVAVLSAVAVPSFGPMIEGNRLATRANNFIGDVQLARYEAIKHGLPVTMCVSTDSKTCTDSTDWQKGWLVFTDTNHNQTVDGDDAVLRQQPGWDGRDALTPGGDVAALTFSRDGFVMNLPGTVSWSLAAQEGESSNRRCISMNITGRVSVKKSAEESCA